VINLHRLLVIAVELNRAEMSSNFVKPQKTIVSERTFTAHMNYNNSVASYASTILGQTTRQIDALCYDKAHASYASTGPDYQADRWIMFAICSSVRLSVNRLLNVIF